MNDHVVTADSQFILLLQTVLISRGMRTITGYMSVVLLCYFHILYVISVKAEQAGAVFGVAFTIVHLQKSG